MTRPTLTPMTLAALLALSGCSDKDVDPADTSDTAAPDDTGDSADSGDTDQPDDTADTDDSGDTGDTGGQNVNLRVAVFDIFYGDYLIGAPITIGDTEGVTASDHYYYVDVPINSHLEVWTKNEGYLDAKLDLFSLEEDLSTALPVLAEDTLATVGAVFGGEYDPARATFYVRAYHRGSDGTLSALPGLTVDLDASYDIALAADPSSSVGLTESNTTADAAVTSILFANVTPGERTLTLTLPESEEYCTWYRGDTRVEDMNLTLYADTLNSVYIVCY